MSNTISLSKVEREELAQLVSTQSGRADEARRARLILLLDAGQTWALIRDKLDCTDSFIDRWSKRFVQERLAGLFSRHAGQTATTLTPALEARILEWSVKRKPSDGSTHWSTRKLAAQLDVSHMMVARVWRKHALRPHRLEGYMASNDPNFETKAADIIGLYLHPPQHAAVFVLMRRLRSKPWIEKIRYFHSRRAALNVMDLSITAMEPFRSMRRSIPKRVRFLARPQRATPRRSLSPSLLTLLPTNLAAKKST